MSCLCIDVKDRAISNDTAGLTTHDSSPKNIKVSEFFKLGENNEGLSNKPTLPSKLPL